MWPDGFGSAVSFTFDFDAEEVWIADDPANADRPGALSQGRYGAKVGVPRVLDLLEQHGIRATFFIPARNAERYPDRVRQIADAGHEIAHHGYTHSSPTEMSRDQEEEELTKGLSILREFSGEVVGTGRPPGTSARIRWTCCSSTGSDTRRTSWTTWFRTGTKARRSSSSPSSGRWTMPRTSGSTARRG